MAIKISGTNVIDDSRNLTGVSMKAVRYDETSVSLSGTTPTVDLSAGNHFKISTTGNTTFAFSNPPSSGTAQKFVITVTAGGAHTHTWPAAVTWIEGADAPSPPDSGDTSNFEFITVDGGTTYYGSLATTGAVN